MLAVVLRAVAVPWVVPAAVTVSSVLEKVIRPAIVPLPPHDPHRGAVVTPPDFRQLPAATSDKSPKLVALVP